MASKKAALEAIRRIKEAKEKGGGIATRLEVGGRGGGCHCGRAGRLVAGPRARLLPFPYAQPAAIW